MYVSSQNALKILEVWVENTGSPTKQTWGKLDSLLNDHFGHMFLIQSFLRVFIEIFPVLSALQQSERETSTNAAVNQCSCQEILFQIIEFII